MLLTLAAFVACWPESPVAPERDGVDVGGPSFAFTGATGKVLGSANRGELVEVDLDSGTVTLIGDAGIFAGDSVGWTDIAFDGSGNLFGLSRLGFESDFEVHLYEIDPSTGAILTDVGSAGDHTFSDFDHDGSDFYGNGREVSGGAGCCIGQLFTIDATSAQATWISSDTVGYGLNPYDTAGSRPIANGGFAVHPATGDLWGIEALLSNATVLYRIDPTTGLADSILKVGPPEYGYDALHILDDGTFLATRGGQEFPRDSVLWEIDPVPDSLGVVAISLIPLTFDTAIVGNLNGLEAMPEDGTFELTLTADTTELHPWVPFISNINGFEQTRIPGDSAALSIAATEDVDVTIRAEFLDGSGGHSHIDSPVSFDDIGAAVDRGAFIQMGSILGQPLAGFLAMAGDSAASFANVPTIDGQMSLTFTAGTVGGLVKVIVETVVDQTAHADTATITIKVPDLIHADTSDVVNSVYFVGGVPNPRDGGPDVHVQASNWYMPQDVAERVEGIASGYRIAHALVVGGGLKYLQHNDASLKFGGTFSVTGLTGDLGDHPTNHQHWSHQLGLDVDFNWCMVAESGDDNQANRVYGTTCPDSTDEVRLPVLERLADAEEACAKVHNGNHFHIRFTGRCSDA